MHDTALTAMTEEVALPHLAPRSPCLTDQLIHLLSEVLLASNEGHALMNASRRRGRPATLALSHLALALLVGVLHGSRHLTTIWRRLSVEPLGPFPAVSLTYEAVRKRLLTHGVAALQHLFEQVSHGLASCSQTLHPCACRLAPFASELLALDETTLDRLRRLTHDMRDLPCGDPHLLPGKLACLFDLRTQRFVRVQFRADVLAACNTALWLLLEGVAPGCLILADLGYFSFAWFDYLTGQGYFWVSRFKEQVSYDLVEVFAYDDATGLLDALIYLGSYRANRAAHAVRLVCFTRAGTRYRYVTNVLSPCQLSIEHLAQLYARRWDIEMAFNLLKRELGLHLWWGARPELVMVQLWVALILAQLLYAVQRYLAHQAQVEPGEVSMHVLIELLDLSPVGPSSVLDTLLEKGHALGLLRPSSRLHITVPSVASSTLSAPPSPPPRPRHARYPRPKTTRPAPFLSRFLTQLVI